MEASRNDEAIWDKHGPLDLKIQFRQDSSKPRQVLRHIKLAASDAVDSDPDLDNAVQLWAGIEHISAGGSTRTDKRPGAAKNKLLKQKRLKKR